MVDNEMLILVYETLQRLSGNVKDTKAAVSAINSKIDSINKRVSELDDIINGVINPGIMTIGEGHEAVHKTLYDTAASLKKDITNTKSVLAEELKTTQDTLSDDFRAAKAALDNELSETRETLNTELKETQEKLDNELAEIKKIFNDKLNNDTKSLSEQISFEIESLRKVHSDISARFEVYELKQRQIEQELKTIKRLR